jgi:hypothetical protein
MAAANHPSRPSVINVEDPKSHERSPFQLSRRRPARSNDDLRSLDEPGVGVDVADHRSPHSFMTMGSVRHSPDPSARTPREAGLVAITYELLDAHADTSRLVADRASDAEWQNHLVYLRDLQRVGREALARAALARAAIER